MIISALLKREGVHGNIKHDDYSLAYSQQQLCIYFNLQADERYCMIFYFLFALLFNFLKHMRMNEAPVNAQRSGIFFFITDVDSINYSV